MKLFDRFTVEIYLPDTVDTGLDAPVQHVFDELGIEARLEVLVKTLLDSRELTQGARVEASES